MRHAYDVLAHVAIAKVALPGEEHGLGAAFHLGLAAEKGVSGVDVLCSQT